MLFPGATGGSKVLQEAPEPQSGSRFGQRGSDRGRQLCLLLVFGVIYVTEEMSSLKERGSEWASRRTVSHAGPGSGAGPSLMMRMMMLLITLTYEITPTCSQSS